LIQVKRDTFRCEHSPDDLPACPNHLPQGVYRVDPADRSRTLSSRGGVVDRRPYVFGAICIAFGAEAAIGAVVTEVTRGCSLAIPRGIARYRVVALRDAPGA
jgi:hypothetical protein